MVQSRLCPICKRPLGEREDTLRFRPFCSKRCAEVDLGRWLHGAYAIPAAEADDSESEPSDGEGADGDKAPPVRH